MRAVQEELTTLVLDLETFLSDGLKGEILSKKAKEKREIFIKRIKEVKQGFPQDFKEKSGEDSGDEEEFDSHNDGGSMHSERTDKDEEPSEGVQQAPPIAAQDLPYVFKAGYLEKRRKDHSFFGTEWQKRWCALSSSTFYYYGNEKGDQIDELSFKRGDAIYILSKEYQNFGWWVGEFNGSVGIIPKDFLMQLYAI
ncbi:hypothetical protein CRUP_004411 [Coryphaenoides rupestris]|nr:hypothetical protein CRUP_004411 [Coryphaenoides rupestris]